jgi:hypothetical protein
MSQKQGHLGGGPGGNRVDDAFEMPEPTYAFGAMWPIVLNPHPEGPSQAEIEDRSLVDAAMAIKNPWAGNPPSLYSQAKNK